MLFMGAFLSNWWKKHSQVVTWVLPYARIWMSSHWNVCLPWIVGVPACLLEMSVVLLVGMHTHKCVCICTDIFKEIVYFWRNWVTGKSKCQWQKKKNPPVYISLRMQVLRSCWLSPISLWSAGFRSGFILLSASEYAGAYSVENIAAPEDLAVMWQPPHHDVKLWCPQFKAEVNKWDCCTLSSDVCLVKELDNLLYKETIRSIHLDYERKD